MKININPQLLRELFTTLFFILSRCVIELGAYGEFNIRVSNARKLLITLIGTSLENAYDIKTISNKFKAVIMLIAYIAFI